MKKELIVVMVMDEEKEAEEVAPTFINDAHLETDIIS